jgi:hypothetical protein
VWTELLPGTSADDATDRGTRGGLINFYREFGAVYTFRRGVSSAAFLSGPFARTLMRPLVRANHVFGAGAVLGRLLRGRRVLVFGSGPSANDLESIPDDVLVLSCKLGPEILAGRRLRRGVDLYYYANLRADAAGRDKRLHLASVIRESRIGVLVCEDPLTLVDVLPLRASYSRLLLDFRSNQLLLQRLIAPKKIHEIRGRSFCPWTSSGVRLIQYAAYFGASEIYLIGIDLGRHGYASGGAMRQWAHEDIDDNFLNILSQRQTNVYSLSARSPIAEYFPVRRWQSEGAETRYSDYGEPTRTRGAKRHARP